MEVTYVVVMKDRHGKYRSFPKTFKNEAHFENWVDYMEVKLGYKYCGRHENN